MTQPVYSKGSGI